MDALTLALAKRYSDGPAHTIVCIGDSITAGAPADFRTYPQWFDVLTGRLHTTVNKGVSGDSTTQMLARFDADVVALTPEYVLINGGKNEISAGTSLATTQQNLADMVEKAMLAGIVPVLSTVIPYGHRGDGTKTFTAQNQADTIELNTWIKAFARRCGLRCVDFYDAMNDGDDWLNDGQVLDDNLHPNRLGMTIMAGALASEFGKKTLVQQVYNASGNLLSNPLMTVDTNADGLPDDWTVYKDATATVTTTLSDHPVEGKLLKMVYSAATPVYGTVRQTLSGWAVGDQVQCLVDANLAALTSSHANPGFVVRLRSQGGDANAYALARWVDAFGGLHRFAATLTVPVGATLLHLEIGFLSAESGTAYFGRPEVRVVG